MCVSVYKYSNQTIVDIQKCNKLLTPISFYSDFFSASASTAAASASGLSVK